MQTTVTFVGHTIGAEGIQPDKAKIESIKNWPRPKNLPKMRSFLGMVNYCRRFIKNFSQQTLKLFGLLKSKTWAWTNEHSKEFEELKDALCSAPVMKLPDQNREFLVSTDASNQALGGVLLQEFEDGLHPVAYFSKKLSEAEKNYPVHDKEMLAVVKSINKWKHYLFGQRFVVHTDHVTLKYFQEQPKLNLRQVRWKEFLQYFDVDIQYKPGKEQFIADTLSRKPEVHAISLPTVADDFDKNVDAWYKADKDFNGILEAMSTPTHILHSQSPQYLTKFKKIGSRLYNISGDDIRLCVPLVGGWRRKLLWEFHKANLAAHVGVNKTLAKLGEQFYWPLMVRDVKKFVRSCEECQRGKTLSLTKAGLLQPLDIPNSPWESISLDFITGLPLTTTKFDAILSVVDRFSKRARFLPCQKAMNAVDTANLIFREIVCQFGLPTSIVSDGDPKFTSEFWTQLFVLWNEASFFNSLSPANRWIN